MSSHTGTNNRGGIFQEKIQKCSVLQREVATRAIWFNLNCMDRENHEHETNEVDMKDNLNALCEALEQCSSAYTSSAERKLSFAEEEGESSGYADDATW